MDHVESLDLHARACAAVAAAEETLRSTSIVTPVVRSPALDRRAGRPVLLKVESFQHTGSFKFRGAYNFMWRAARSDLLSGGVVACSSGNHALGVAEAARRIGCRALVIIPADAPEMKVRRLRALGAECGTYSEGQDREAMAQKLARARGAIIAPSADDLAVIAGQATATLELLREAASVDLLLTQIVVPVGGGGLFAGARVACDLESPASCVVGVEPAGFDDFRQSLALNHPISHEATNKTICDGLKTARPAAQAFELVKGRNVACEIVSDAQVCEAIAFAHDELKLVLEPSGAAALAAVLSRRIPGEGAMGVLLSGGNASAAQLASLLALPVIAPPLEQHA